MSFKVRTTTATLAVVDVVRTERVSPNFVRVTVGGEQLASLPHHGFDHWFRLFLPNQSGTTSWALPSRVDMIGYLKFKRMPDDVRPVMRNYTVRDFRPEAGELDIDFVTHGDEGVAGRWAANATAGERIALLDQGRGYEYPDDTTAHLLVTDETGLPAVAGILRDLPRDATGAAYIEIPHADDEQLTGAPEGVEVHWVVRDHGARPGSAVLDVVKSKPIPAGTLAAYLVGEQLLPTSLRRWLVQEHAVPKHAITFVGYWKMAK
jgi:NADPH-dependent ferric siderophore reductase